MLCDYKYKISWEPLMSEFLLDAMYHKFRPSNTSPVPLTGFYPSDFPKNYHHHYIYQKACKLQHKPMNNITRQKSYSPREKVSS